MFTDEEVKEFIQEYTPGSFRLDLSFDTEQDGLELKTFELTSGRTISIARREGDVIWTFYKVE